MPATATTPATTREILEDRWQMAKVGTRRFVGENGVTWSTSKRYDRIQRSLEELGALLVEDGVSDDEYDDEQDGLRVTVDAIWDDIEARLLPWAERADTRRTRIHAARLSAQAAS